MTDAFTRVTIFGMSGHDEDCQMSGMFFPCVSSGSFMHWSQKMPTSNIFFAVVCLDVLRPAGTWHQDDCLHRPVLGVVML